MAHGGIANRVKVRLDWVDSEVFEQPGTVQRLEGVHGILVPGGFGERGTPGKIAAVRFARERKVPFFGICFGMQMAVIEAARNLAGMARRVVDRVRPMRDAGGRPADRMGARQPDRAPHRGRRMGGTMRLGAYPAVLGEGSLVREIYGGAPSIEERHRHRYEVNVNFRTHAWRRPGCGSRGMSPDGVLPEIIELPGHPGSSACSIIRN